MDSSAQEQPVSIKTPCGVLSGTQIENEMENGNIIIHPFDRSRLQSSSYDISIGEWYFTERHLNFGDQNWLVSDPFKVLGNIPIQLLHGPSARKLWSSAPKKTISFNDWIILSKPFYLTKDVYIQCLRRIDINFNLSDKIIPIYPKETILAHTNEYIGGRNFITTSMQARSTVGRTCLAICKCAGWGDVGYFNRWTMEITNFSNHVILIPANAIIGQIIFQTVSQAKNELLDYVSKGSYQNSSDLQQTILNWKPEMMLPANKLAAAK